MVGRWKKDGINYSASKRHSFLTFQLMTTLFPISAIISTTKKRQQLKEHLCRRDSKFSGTQGSRLYCPFRALFRSPEPRKQQLTCLRSECLGISNSSKDSASAHCMKVSLISCTVSTGTGTAWNTKSGLHKGVFDLLHCVHWDWNSLEHEEQITWKCLMCVPTQAPSCPLRPQQPAI